MTFVFAWVIYWPQTGVSSCIEMFRVRDVVKRKIKFCDSAWNTLHEAAAGRKRYPCEPSTSELLARWFLHRYLGTFVYQLSSDHTEASICCTPVFGKRYLQCSKLKFRSLLELMWAKVPSPPGTWFKSRPSQNSSRGRCAGRYWRYTCMR